MTEFTTLELGEEWSFNPIIHDAISLYIIEGTTSEICLLKNKLFNAYMDDAVLLHTIEETGEYKIAFFFMNLQTISPDKIVTA